MSIHSSIIYVRTGLAIAVTLLSVRTAQSAGHDFIDEARAILNVAACGAGPLPAGIDAAAVRDHCSRMARSVGHYRESFITKAMPFFAEKRPDGLPRTVVVPFGGGDLLPALIVYPEAGEITTISLESGGDPRRLAAANPFQLRQALQSYRESVGFMLNTNDNSNDSVRNLDHGAIPNQLAYSLTALAVLGYEPVSLKYFRLGDDGSLHYYSMEEIRSLEKTHAKRLKGSWIDTDYSVAFRNMELCFRKKGAGGTVIVHRHIAFNLDDPHFSVSPLRKHLESKGRVSVLIKGASYLPWFDNFSAVRNYLLGHMAYCVSDSTGILPRHAAKAGYYQTAYGTFNGAYLENEGGENAAQMRGLFRSQPHRDLPFRFGDADIHRANHLIITRPK